VQRTPPNGSDGGYWLSEEAIGATITASQHVLAAQIAQAMQAQRITRTEMARRLRTDQEQLEQLLDPFNDAVRLDIVLRAAAVLGRKLKLELV
jgi:antitoxin HicB